MNNSDYDLQPVSPDCPDGSDCPDGGGGANVGTGLDGSEGVEEECDTRVRPSPLQPVNKNETSMRPQATWLFDHGAGPVSRVVVEAMLMSAKIIVMTRLLYSPGTMAS